MSNQLLEDLFPNLKQSSYRITSPESFEYNCIAWAAGDTDTLWWPDPYCQYFWPEEVPRSETLDSFIKAFTFMDYQVCDSPDYEEGFEKVAIYVDTNDKPTHAARQLESGYWSSKLGQSYDIEHELDGVSNTTYGSIAVFLKKSRWRNRDLHS